MSNTGSANAVTHHYRPEWRLGEIGDIIRKRNEQEAETEEDIQKLIQYTEADLDYAQRIFSVIDLTLKEVREKGLNKELAVAVESVKPGAIPKNVLNCMTTNYTSSYKNETIVALEVSRSNLIFVVVLALIGLILKILNWILRNKNTSSKAYTSSSAAISAFTEATNTAAAEVTVPFIETIKSVVVKSAFVRHFEQVAENDLARFETFCAKIDTFITDTHSDNLFATLSHFNNDVAIIDGIFKSYLDDKNYDFEQILDGVLLAIINTGITTCFMDQSTADKCFDKLPIVLRNSGIKILGRGLVDKIDVNNKILIDNLRKYHLAALDLFNISKYDSTSEMYNQDKIKSGSDAFIESVSGIHDSILNMAVNGNCPNGRVIDSQINSLLAVLLPAYNPTFPGSALYDIPQEMGVGFEFMPGDALVDRTITFFSKKAILSNTTTTEYLSNMSESDKLELLAALSLLNPDKIQKVSMPSSLGVFESEIKIIKRDLEGLTNRVTTATLRADRRISISEQEHPSGGMIIDSYLTMKAAGGNHGKDKSIGWISAMYENDRPYGFISGFDIVLRIYRGFLQSEGHVNELIGVSNESIFVKKK